MLVSVEGFGRRLDVQPRWKTDDDRIEIRSSQEGHVIGHDIHVGCVSAHVLLRLRMRLCHRHELRPLQPPERLQMDELDNPTAPEQSETDFVHGRRPPTSAPSSQHCRAMDIRKSHSASGKSVKGTVKLSR